MLSFMQINKNPVTTNRNPAETAENHPDEPFAKLSRISDFNGKHDITNRKAPK